MNSTAFSYLIQADITGAPKTVLTTLITHCHDKGYCFPSVKRIGQISGLSKATIHRALNCLKELEIITVVHRFNKEGKKSSNLYILNGLEEMMEDKTTKKNRRVMSHDESYKISFEKANNTYEQASEQKDSGFALANEYDDQKISNSPKPKQEPVVAPKVKESPVTAQTVKQTPVTAQTAKQTPVTAQTAKQTPVTAPKPVRFEGHLDKHKILEIFELYTKHNFLNRCVSDLIDLLACCSYLNRESEKDKKRPVHKRKIKNKYGLLTFLTKTKQLTKPIKWADDEKARLAIGEFRACGLIDF